MNDESIDNERIVISYLVLRKAIGCLAMALPIILALGGMLLFQMGIQGSISDYYYTLMRGVFVGTMFSIGVFLFSYKGYEPKDDRYGDFACVFAVGLALLPTTPVDPSTVEKIIGGFHLGFAGAFFLTLAYFSIKLFTKTDETRPATNQKLKRNVVYKFCGYTILVALGLIGLLTLLPDTINDGLEHLDLVFWLEALMIFAFGVSWFTKGEGILGDEN
jgi:hypothetical protein